VTPTLPGGFLARQVIAGKDFSIVISLDGRMVTFGNNNIGQLGLNGGATPQPVPTEIYMAGALNGFTMTAAGAGPNFVVAVAGT
jgi:alpha-tubulin suppressor-like RCC1 family protein